MVSYQVLATNKRTRVHTAAKSFHIPKVLRCGLVKVSHAFCCDAATNTSPRTSPGGWEGGREREEGDRGMEIERGRYGGEREGGRER